MAKMQEVMPGGIFKHGVITVDGIPIRYAEAGSGPAILSIPGSAGLEMSIAKDMLAKEFRVVELNQPGWGPDDEWVGEQEQKAIGVTLAKAAEALGLDRYHLLGTSMGANIAFWIAILHPERVLSMTLEGGDTFTRAQDRTGFTPQQARRLMEIRQGSPWCEGDEKIWIAPTLPRKWWFNQDFYIMQMKYRFKNFRHTRNNHQDELVAALPSLTMPILALLGDKDEIILSSVFEAWENLLPSSIRVILPGGHHDLQNTVPECMISVMKEHVLGNNLSTATLPPASAYQG